MDFLYSMATRSEDQSLSDREQREKEGLASLNCVLSVGHLIEIMGVGVNEMYSPALSTSIQS